MAIIKFGMMMTDARGKLGGHVLSKNRGGNYVRTNNVPSNPQSNFQTGVRAAFARNFKRVEWINRCAACGVE